MTEKPLAAPPPANTERKPPAAPQANSPEPPKEAEDVYEALLYAQESFGPIVKDASNPYFNSKYLSLPKLLEAVRPALTKYGILIQSRYVSADGVWVETKLYHVPSGTSAISLFPVSDTTNPQKMGSAGSYGFRYNLMHLLGIAPEDDDANAASSPGKFEGPVPDGNQRSAPRRTASYSAQPPHIAGFE